MQAGSGVANLYDRKMLLERLDGALSLSIF